MCRQWTSGSSSHHQAPCDNAFKVSDACCGGTAAPMGKRKHRAFTSSTHADSSEENIYGKLDWDETTGVDRNKFYLWDLETNREVRTALHGRPCRRRMQIDADSLEAGSLYPGQYEGAELSCDSQRNVTNADGQYAGDTADLAEAILKIKGSGGKFRVTPKRHFVLVRVPADEEWETLYVTQLAKAAALRCALRERVARARTQRSGRAAPEPAILTPLRACPWSRTDFVSNRSSGGVISKKVRGGEVFARRGDNAESAGKGADAARLVAAIKNFRRSEKSQSNRNQRSATRALPGRLGNCSSSALFSEGLEFPQTAAGIGSRCDECRRNSVSGMSARRRGPAAMDG